MMKIFLICLITVSVFLLRADYITNENVSYKSHIQGIAADETGIYWSFTNILVKTDYEGKVLKEVTNPTHGGDLCIADGDIYLAVQYREPEMIAANNKRRAVVYRYSSDLVFKKKYPLAINEGIDGITFYKGKFYVAPDLGKTPKKESYVLLYDKDFNFIKKLDIKTDSLKKFGVQTLNVVNGKILASYYDNAKNSPLLDPETMKVTGSIDIRPSVGLAYVPEKISGNKNTYLYSMLHRKDGSWKCRARIITIGQDNQVNHSSKLK